MCLIHHLGIFFFLALKQIHLQTPEAPRRTHEPSGEWSECRSHRRADHLCLKMGMGPMKCRSFHMFFMVKRDFLNIFEP